MANPKMRTIRRAARAVGGAADLAEALGVTVQAVEAWLMGRSIPGDALYMRALDIVAQGRFSTQKGAPDD
jgi:hypothetical protein